MLYEINLTDFSGPLHKLLELIEDKKYEITEVSLGDVTGDFLSHIESLKENGYEPRLLADFIAVAARLLLIKSKVLLPDLELSTEEQADIRDLESRLKLYKEFHEAGENIKSLWDKRLVSYVREKVPASSPVFYPPSWLDIESIRKAISSLQISMDAYQNEEEEYKVVNFEECVVDLFERVKGRISSFKALSADKDKREVIMLFLAILHLLKESDIEIEQEEQFSDILIKTPENK